MAKRRTPKGRGEVEKLPTGRFRARLSRTVVAGGEKVRARASKTFRTRREAWDWLDAQGRTGAATATATQTVGEWIDVWLAGQKTKVSASTYQVDEWATRCHVRPGLAPVRLRDLDAPTVDRWLAALKAGGATETTRYVAGACLRKCLNAAVRAKALAANPMRGGAVPLSSPERAEKKVMTAAQVRAVVAAADAVGIGHAFRLWFDAGLRPGEMFALRWEDLDPAVGTVSIRRATNSRTNEAKSTKTAKGRRTLPLSPATLAALAAARPSNGAGLVMPTPGGKTYWAGNFSTGVAGPIFAAAGVAGLGFNRYTFRHTMASLLISAGLSIVVVSRRLGHAKVSMTLDTYAHLMPSDAEKAAEVMGGVFAPPAP